MPFIIGLISDTHGRLRPEVAPALEGVDLILHAGDVGSQDVLVELGLIAPVRAVFGNVDDPFTPGLDERLDLQAEGWSVVVTHGHRLRSLTAAHLLRHFDARIIVYGHTHRPLIHREEGRLVVNPGAAGPRRFDIMPSVARLALTPASADVEHISL